MGDIDDLSRELTEEIEAHRVTRERAEQAEKELAALNEQCVQINSLHDAAEARARSLYDDLTAMRLLLEKAEASKAALIDEIREWCDDSQGIGLRSILAKHRVQS